jgi:hypothetical protein
VAACRELSVVVGVGKKCGEAAWASELLPCKQAFKRVATRSRCNSLEGLLARQYASSMERARRRA